MAVRDAMREAATPHLRDGESLQAVFMGQTASQYMVGLSKAIPLIPVRNAYRIFAVTPQRIIVIESNSMVRGKRTVLTELPRSTRLGPAKGLWHTFPADRETIHVHRRFFQDIVAADGATVTA
jgi:hypothetical protein